MAQTLPAGAAEMVLRLGKMCLRDAFGAAIARALGAARNSWTCGPATATERAQQTAGSSDLRVGRGPPSQMRTVSGNGSFFPNASLAGRYQIKRSTPVNNSAQRSLNSFLQHLAPLAPRSRAPCTRITKLTLGLVCLVSAMYRLQDSRHRVGEERYL